MSRVTIAVDLAKNVFELAISEAPGRITCRRRLSRAQFERFWTDQPNCRVVMEACATSHHWGRRLCRLGFDVVLIPPRYVRPYVRRNKTDRTDCEALLEADRCSGIHPVPVKTESSRPSPRCIACAPSGPQPEPHASTGCAGCSPSSGFPDRPEPSAFSTSSTPPREARDPPVDYCDRVDDL
jgi:hypothetical protein